MISVKGAPGMIFLYITAHHKDTIDLCKCSAEGVAGEGTLLSIKGPATAAFRFITRLMNVNYRKNLGREIYDWKFIIGRMQHDKQ